MTVYGFRCLYLIRVLCTILAYLSTFIGAWAGTVIFCSVLCLRRNRGLGVGGSFRLFGSGWWGWDGVESKVGG